MFNNYSIPVALITIALGGLASCGGGGGSLSNDDGDPGSNSGSFEVSFVTPSQGSVRSSFPSMITIGFTNNLDQVPTSNDIEVWQSGGDDTFSDGNETQITPDAISLSGATVSLDFSGTNMTDDSYEIRVLSTSSLLDTDGNELDGDKGSSPGEAFSLDFSADSGVAVTPSFSDVQAILTTNCTSSACHDSVDPQQSMSLVSGAAYTSIVFRSSNEVPSLKRINPGNEGSSYLVEKIDSTSPQVGERMPRFQNPLNESDIDLIKAWVTAGAVND